MEAFNHFLWGIGSKNNFGRTISSRQCASAHTHQMPSPVQSLKCSVLVRDTSYVCVIGFLAWGKFHSLFLNDIQNFIGKSIVVNSMVNQTNNFVVKLLLTRVCFHKNSTQRLYTGNQKPDNTNVHMLEKLTFLTLILKNSWKNITTFIWLNEGDIDKNKLCVLIP